MTSSTAPPVFAHAVAFGGLNPRDYDHLWVEAGAMNSSASRSQLELPRGCNTFFGANFDDYDSNRVELILALTLTMGTHHWEDKKLTWHGVKEMERINLPTVAQGGLPYEDTAILFTRGAGEFEITVVPWSGEIAESWRKNSVEINRLYRTGVNSNRICGLFGSAPPQIH